MIATFLGPTERAVYEVWYFFFWGGGGGGGNSSCEMTPLACINMMCLPPPCNLLTFEI